MPESSASTPESRSAEPKKQGKSLRAATSRRSVSSASVPSSRYSESASSSVSAAVSAKSGAAASAQPAPNESRSSASRAFGSTPGRSVLFTKRNTGTPYRSSSRQSVRVWLCTPSAPLTTSTAQSSTCMVRSASVEKSTWPGVSSSVTSVSGSGRIACFEKIVMPRSRSIASESRNASPWSTRPSLRSRPAVKSIASESVVFPASTCASSPRQSGRFRLFSSAAGIAGTPSGEFAVQKQKKRRRSGARLPLISGFLGLSKRIIANRTGKIKAGPALFRKTGSCKTRHCLV